MTARATLLALLLLMPTVAAAAPPETAPRPEDRPWMPVEVRRMTLAVPSVSALVLQAPRPSARPEGLVQRVMSAIPRNDRRNSMGGRICGDRTIRGRVLPPIDGRLNGCGVAKPVSLTAVAGVSLSTPAVVDCTTAKALKTWVQRAALPGVGRRGGGLVGLTVAAHYSCRGRNNQADAKISEHGKGRAIDISGLRLADGSAITVAEGWNAPADTRLLHGLHDRACGTFGTVLGPGSDGYHSDHFHFDTARYRGGAYCR